MKFKGALIAFATCAAVFVASAREYVVGIADICRTNDLSEVKPDYPAAVCASGATPYVLPFTEDDAKVSAAVADADALMIAGGMGKRQDYKRRCAFEDRAPSDERYDVLVVGGTTRGIEAAKTAKAAGKSVYLVTAHPYLGEDRAGTLELGWGDGVRPQTALESRLWRTTRDYASFDYQFDHPTQGIRAIFSNDPWERLSNLTPPHIMSDGVLYLDDVTYTCTLKTSGEIATVTAMALESPAYLVNNILRKEELARLEKEKPGVRRVATAGVWVKPLDGPRAGERIELRRVGEPVAIPGDFAHATGMGVRFEADVATTFTRAEICFRADPTAHHQLVARIAFRRTESVTVEEMPSPLRVKQVFDRELLDADVDFITSSPVRRVLRRPDGTLEGVEIVNRSGRRTIRADEVVDATLYGTLGKVPAVSAEETFSRIVISHRAAPSAPGMKVETFPERLTAPHSTFDGRAYRCTFSVPMKDGSFPSFAAAEWASRELTRTPALADAADFLVWHPSPAALAGAKPMSDELPLWGEYDVVVVGGGTAGAAAAVAAARNGARTLVVEYLETLGGVGTDGMVGGFYDGNMVGFATELKEATAKEKGLCQYKRAEAWRRLCRESGVTVWFGAMGLGAVCAGDRVVGVEVATALGCGRVRATCVVDGTGNSDVAAAAGAATELFGAGEFGVQSAGQAPQRLGRGGGNTDFGYLNDADANDLWLFMVRARAGAPVGWDIAKMPDSRERRRIVPDLRVTGEDAVGRRRYPDVIVQARSRQDPHSYLTDDFAYLAEASTELVPGAHESREMFNINIPLRATLPRGLSGIAVCGLGAGLERDVLAITRMQGDLVNMGYSVGTAAALAAKKGGEFRAVDLRELRANLVKKGVLRAETLAWETDDDISSDELIAASVKTLPDGYRGGHVVYRPENRARALPLLRTALAEAKDEKATQAYALALGLLGDASGLDVLLGLVSGDRAEVDVRAGHRGVSYGRGAVVDFGGGSIRAGALLAIGRTRDPRALRPLLAVLDEVTSASELGQVRPITLALEALASPDAAKALAAKLRLPGIGGHAVADFRKLPPLGGYGIGPEFDKCLREIALARALMACGDCDGLARRTFEAYSRDPRGALAAHAKAVLRAHP